MNRFFNTPFEMELRILMLLMNSTLETLDKNQLICYDFICCYGKDYRVADANLHGDSSYKFGEIASRKELVDMAIKKLVTSGLINVKQEDGFRYEINDNGINYIDSLENQYCETYMKTAEAAFGKYDLSEKDAAHKFIVNLTKRGGFRDVQN